MTPPTDDRLRRRFEYEAEVDSVAAARNDVSEFVMAKLGSPYDRDQQLQLLIDRLAVVVSELSSNAVEAVPGRSYHIDIVVTLGVNGDPAGTVACAVGCPRSEADDEMPVLGILPDPLAERGRGLAIVDKLADRCRVDRTAEELVVTAELDLIT